jgi:YD repeat-containing protein
LLIVVGVSAQVTSQVTYVYDELGRLVAVIDPAGEAAVYKYDPVGNLLSISRRTSSQISIIEVTPDSGTVGSTVTIYGTAFGATAGENIVSFNGTTASVTSASSTRITAVVPAGAATGPITVNSPSGSATSDTPFTVTAGDATSPPTITSFSPTIATAGSAITINGTNFETTPADNRLEFNVLPSAISSATANSLAAPALRGGSGRISVTTPFGKAVSAADLFVPPPPFTPAEVSHTGRIVYGQDTIVSITQPGTVGMLIFDGRAGQRVSLLLSQLSANAKISIYKPDEKVLIGTDFYTWSENRFIDTHILPKDGSYTIIIDPAGTDSTIVSLKLYDVPPDVVDTIGMNTYKTVQVTVPGQNILLKYTASAGQRVLTKFYDHTMSHAAAAKSLVSVGVPSGGFAAGKSGGGGSGDDPYKMICSGGCSYNGLSDYGGKKVGEALVNGTDPTYYPDAETLPAADEYMIFFDPMADNTGSVTINLREVPPDLSYNITADGTPVSVNTAEAGRNVWMQFSGTAGQKVSLKLSNNTYAGSTYVSINKPDGTYLLNRTTFGASGKFIEPVTLPDTGTYKIYIDPNGDSTGAITATLYSVVDATGTMTIDGPSLPVTLTTPGQNGRLTFSGAAGQQITLRMTSVTIPGATTVNILNPDGTALVNFYNLSTSGGFIDSKTLPVTGTYSIIVNPAEANTGNATLTLGGNVDVTNTISVGGPPVTVTTTTSGQNAQLFFEGIAGQAVSLKLNNASYAGVGPGNYVGTVTVTRPGGTTLVQPTAYTNGGIFIDQRMLTETGTYKILLDVYSTYTGSITATLYNSTNVTGTIIPGGAAVSAATTSPGQNIALTFNGSSGQRVSLQTSNTSISSGYVSIRRADNYSLGGDGIVGTSSRYIDAITLPANGVYTVFVDPNVEHTGGITLLLYDVAPDVVAPITPNGSPVTVTNTSPGQDGRLTFTGTAGRRVSLKLSSPSYPNAPFGSYAGAVSIIRPGGANLLSPTMYTMNGIFVDSQLLPDSGTYTILINVDTTLIGSVNAVLYDFVHVTGTITPGGAAVTATTTSPGQNIVLTFNGTAGQRVSLQTSNTTIAAGYITVRKPDGFSLMESPIIGSSRYLDAATLPASGTYTITVDPNGENTGSIVLTLSDVAADTNSTITAGGEAVTAANTAAGQNARFTFTGTAGQKISLKLLNASYPNAPWGSYYGSLSIIKPNGTNLVNPASYTINGYYLDTVILPDAGTYTILVDVYDSLIGSIDVVLYDASDVVDVITPGGAAVQVNLNSPGQIARLTFSGTAGQQATVRVTGNTMGITNVKLSKPDGTQLTITTASVGSFNLTTQTLPVTGTYTITVDPSAANTGGMSISVTNP